ncbi:clp protease-related protein chloroplastic-like [Trifolium pratense]|uniref:Clp protease-related protein chloroplastic-like n=1 Tax=Trifolium pratense TaxID=57577 RepID=A0A2K3PBG9_TRIPR|nr:clp protease-related protein chloroplastic-like [Trifolium pratense]
MASIPTFSSYSLLLKPNNTNTLFPNSNSSSSSSSSCTLSLLPLFGTKLTLQRPISSTRSISIANFSATSETVPFNLPTDPNPQSDEVQKNPNPNPKPKWSARAIRSYAMAENEVRVLKYPKIGTESLLMGILIEGTSKAAKFLRANGITFFKVQEQTLELLGKSNYFFSTPRPTPLTEPLKKVLDSAVNEKLKSGNVYVREKISVGGKLIKCHGCNRMYYTENRSYYDKDLGEEGETNVTHLLLAIWSQEESAGRKILATLGFNDEKAEEIAKTAASGDIDWSFQKEA